MSYVITMRRKAGQGPIPVHAPGMTEQSARIMAAQLALMSQRVTLTELDNDGIPTVIARWVGGKSDGNLPSAKALPKPEPRIIDAEPVTAALTNLRSAAEEFVEATAETGEAEEFVEDEAHTYTAQCMKCREKREFVGHVVELANGSHAAKGNCPVCGTGLFRMVARNIPVDEWDDEGHVDHIEPSEPVAEAPAPEAETPEPEAEPESLTEAVEAGVVSVPEFSDAVAEDAELAPAVAEVVAEEKPAPRKRASRSRKAKDQAVEPPAEPEATDADVERVKAMQVAECPQCHQKIPYQTRGAAGKEITYFLTHPGNGKDRCEGSLSNVES